MIRNTTTDTVLATDVRIADSILRKTVGAIPDQPLKDGYGIVFPWDGPADRRIHMLFVREPLDVLWLEEGSVQSVKTLSPWFGNYEWYADTVVELPAGVAAETEVGHEIEYPSEGP